MTMTFVLLDEADAGSAQRSAVGRDLPALSAIVRRECFIASDEIRDDGEECGDRVHFGSDLHRIVSSLPVATTVIALPRARTSATGGKSRPTEKPLLGPRAV